MNFELTSEVKTSDSEHTIDFVRHPFNVLEALRAFLCQRGINESDILSVINRTTGESVSFDEAKPALDKLFYRNEYPEYEETNSETFKYVEHPIVNPDMVFKLIFGNFIDFQSFNQTTYDGGYLYWDFRYNEIVSRLAPSREVEMHIYFEDMKVGPPGYDGRLPDDIAKPKLRSFEEERGGGYMFKQEGYNFRVDKDGGTDE